MFSVRSRGRARASGFPASRVRPMSSQEHQSVSDRRCRLTYGLGRAGTQFRASQPLRYDSLNAHGHVKVFDGKRAFGSGCEVRLPKATGLEAKHPRPPPLLCPAQYGLRKRRAWRSGQKLRLSAERGQKDIFSPPPPPASCAAMSVCGGLAGYNEPFWPRPWPGKPRTGAVSLRNRPSAIWFRRKMRAWGQGIRDRAFS